MTSINNDTTITAPIHVKGNIIHHHFNGLVTITYIPANSTQTTTQNNYGLGKVMTITIGNNTIFFFIDKVEKMNSYDLKLYISSNQYSETFSQEVLDLFNKLGMLQTPTTMYLKRDLDLNVWYLKNINFTTMFLLM